MEHLLAAFSPGRQRQHDYTLAEVIDSISSVALLGGLRGEWWRENI
jgi:hypothetical protein